MGNDNLNRVFIKAYGKGNTADLTQSSSDAALPAESYLVRFDTATVPIPSPHLFNTPREGGQHSIARPVKPELPVGGTNNHQPQAMASAAPWQAAAGELQQSQSVEMTEWDETMYSLLFGGSTMVVPNTTRQSSMTTRTLQETTAAHRPAQLSQVQPSPQPELKSQPEIKSQTQPVLNTSSKSVANSEQYTGPGENETRTANSNATADLAQMLQTKNRGGEIFRLDRPSYAIPGAAASNVNDQLAEEEGSHTALDLELHQTMQPAAPQVSSAAQQRSLETARRKEQALRRSRVKIFNPLWEVDRLQWPKVCEELSEAISHRAGEVVENLLKACQDGLQVLAMTSPQSGEGTSTVACCLAMLAGKRGLNVALVDGNIENPSLAYQTNLELDVDWHEAVAKRLPLEEIAVHSVEDQITLVPLLERLNAPELNEHNVARMLQELAQSFDLVIVDLGSMTTTRNMVRKLGELGVLHAVVAVIDQRIGSMERVEDCLRQIRQSGIVSVGLVENFAA